MRPHVYTLAFILGSASLAQAAAYNRRQEAPSNTPNLADGFMSMFNRLGVGAQTVTETQTITVGGGGGAGAVANATAVTVTVTAAASTVTVCPGLANGAVDGVEGGGSASAPAGGAGSGAAPPVVVATGGIGVTVIPVPEDARKTSQVGSPPAVTPPANPPADPATNPPAASSDAAGASSSLAPLPSQGGADQPELVPPPGLSATPSATSLAPLLSSQPPPAAADPSAVPIVSAPASESTAADSGTSLAPPPGLASSLTNTLVLPSNVNAAPVATPVPNPEGAFGGVAGLIPIESALIVTPTPTTPGAGVGPTINLSGLTLSSQLNLGNLVQPTVSPIT